MNLFEKSAGDFGGVDALFAAARRQLSAKEIAEQLFVRNGTVERWVKKNTVPPFYRNDLLRILGKTDAFEIGIEESDQFYTLPAVAGACLQDFKGALKSYGFSMRGRTFVEPAAGCGSFYNLLPANNRIGLDIDPQKSPLSGLSAEGIVKADFLQWSPPAKGRYVVVGNPPFGRNGKTALDFVVKSFAFADFVGFILPPIFNSTGKGSCRNRLVNQGRALLLNKELDDVSFVRPDNRRVAIKTIFQVWARQHPAGYEETKPPTCDSFVDIYNIYISNKKGRPSSRKHLAGKCDIYIPRSFWGSRPVAATCDFSKIPYQDGYGIIVKKQKRAVVNFIGNFDWRKVAHVSTNGSMSLRRDIIREQLTAAGFVDEGIL